MRIHVVPPLSSPTSAPPPLDSLHTPTAHSPTTPLTVGLGVMGGMWGAMKDLGSTVATVRYVAPATPRKHFEPPALDPTEPNRNPFSPFRPSAVSPLPWEGRSIHAAVVVARHSHPPTPHPSTPPPPTDGDTPPRKMRAIVWETPSREGARMTGWERGDDPHVLTALRFDDVSALINYDTPEHSLDATVVETPRDVSVSHSMPSTALSLDGSRRFSLLHSMTRNGEAYHMYVPLHVDVNGMVWLGIGMMDGMPYAVKQVPHSIDISDEVRALTIGNRPTELHQSWAELFIVRYYAAFDEPQCHVVQLEYSPMGTLWEAWPTLPTPRQLTCCVIQVLQGLAALHREGFVHGAPMYYNVLAVRSHHYKLTNLGAVTRIGTPMVWAVPLWMHPPFGHPATGCPAAREGYMMLRSLIARLGELSGVACDGGRVPPAVALAYVGTHAHDVLQEIDAVLAGAVDADPTTLLGRGKALRPPANAQFLLQRAYDKEAQLLQQQIKFLRKYEMNLETSCGGVTDTSALLDQAALDDILSNLLQEFEMRDPSKASSVEAVSVCMGASMPVLSEPMSLADGMPFTRTRW